MCVCDASRLGLLYDANMSQIGFNWVLMMKTAVWNKMLLDTKRL